MSAASPRASASSARGDARAVGGDGDGPFAEGEERGLRDDGAVDPAAERDRDAGQLGEDGEQPVALRGEFGGEVGSVHKEVYGAIDG